MSSADCKMLSEVCGNWPHIGGRVAREVIETESPPLLQVTLALTEPSDSDVVNVMRGCLHAYFLIYHFIISAETFILFFSSNGDSLNTLPNIFFTQILD